MAERECEIRGIARSGGVIGAEIESQVAFSGMWRRTSGHRMLGCYLNRELQRTGLKVGVGWRSEELGNLIHRCGEGDVVTREGTEERLKNENKGRFKGRSWIR